MPDPTSSAELQGLPTFAPTSDIVVDTREPVELKPLDSAAMHRLGEIPATAICGNDITSSCLYVAALSAIYAGKYAPIALLMVAAVLYLYRWVYAEVGDALPLNGGAYNCLLNTTSKFRASMAACMTILSYVATAVISAGEAMHYAKNLWEPLPTFEATVALLGLFALLNIIGISESAAVAVGIFGFHLLTLVGFSVIGAFSILRDPSVLAANWSAPSELDLPTALFFGFAAALLGISGFESSANFIEEQEEGVFPNTLRNMWAAVSIFNPLICLLVLGILPLAVMKDHSEDLLAYSGGVMAGGWFRTLVSIDATLVLSGAVLTSFVGTTGLVKRLTLDRCLPQFLLKENRWRKTSHRIILAFFALCASILVATRGDLRTLAGVYTISFLGVMSLFAVGNMLLKVNRRDLPRRFYASWLTVSLALLATVMGLIGNIALNPAYFSVFLTYFIPTAAVISAMLWRTTILRGALFVVRSSVDFLNTYNRRMSSAIIGKIDEINSHGIVFFTKGDSRKNLNEAMLYVRNNEMTKRLKVVHVYSREEDIPPRLGLDLAFLDEVYPEISVEFITVRGKFGPELIERLSREWSIAKNYMFIGSPSGRFPYRISELGGVRLII
ncbi:MAG: APC family permease [Bryobacteraceae bacterium]